MLPKTATYRKDDRSVTVRGQRGLQTTAVSSRQDLSNFHDGHGPYEDYQPVQGPTKGLKDVRPFKKFDRLGATKKSNEGWP